MPDYKSDKPLGLVSSVSQGLSSAGPMLNIFGLFPVLVAIAFRMSFYVILLSSLVGFLAIYTGYTFSKLMRSNGGYYTYVGRVVGKEIGFITALLYLSYGLLAVPSVVLFLVFFTGYAFPVASLSGVPSELLLSLLFSGVIALISAKGLRTISRFVTMSSFIEIAAIALFSVVLLFSRGSVFTVPAGIDPVMVMQALPFGVLAFAGVGSSIFLSENVAKWRTTVSGSVKYSFLLLLILMAVPAFVLSFTTSGKSLLEYSYDPISIVYSGNFIPGILSMIFIILAINSAINLAAGYINALKQAASRMVTDAVLPDPHGLMSRRMWTFIVAVGSALSIAGILWVGPYSAFVIVSGTVSILFLMIHSISNAALLKYFRSSRRLARSVIPAVSTASFAVVIVYEALGGGPFASSALISISVLIAVIAITAIMRMGSWERFQKIQFGAETNDLP